MATPFLATLSARQRRLFPLIERGVAAGLSSRAINDALVAATGEGIRRQTLLDIIRAVRGVELAQDALKAIRPEFVPDPRRVPLALTAIRRRFSSVVEVRGHLADVGESIVRHVQISDDVLRSRTAIEDEALNILEENAEEYGIIVERVLLLRTIQRA